ncbi:MAG TPA: isocitrate lyase/phosphoenolpyruvate mutase family protein [Pyrinomonadaceae bacterium]|nr:isocitrate lyase/phosphoenolpyruvate mutase family protein [Pyrinomonadaceae bacterium]
MNETQRKAVEVFAALHKAGCFVIPNPWDMGSAIYLQHLGFKALASTSSGFAFSQGWTDTSSAALLAAVLVHLRDIVQATSVPVNADFRNGYADEPEGVAANVALCVATGVAGLSIEDSTEDSTTPLYDIQLAVERIKAARRAIDASGVPVILTGRCEAWLTGDPNALKTSIERLTAYAEAGADCLFAPGVSDPREIEAIVKAVSPKPVNVLASRPDQTFTVARLADLGVRRISVGSALARVAWGAFMRAAQSIATTGSFESLGEGAAFTDLITVFQKRDHP